MQFTKMEGLGNDYVYVDALRETVADPVALARRVSDRRFGIGSDGLILIRPSETADVRMEMYNADGSRAEMCGNGIRCVGKYAYEHGIATKPTITCETDSGIKTLDLTVEGGKVALVRVDMGVPEFERARIPMLGDAGRVIAEPLHVQDHLVRVTALSMGNPHCVTFVEDVERYPVTRVGPAVENHPLFPKRVNAEFVQVVSRNELIQRTWERGSGETFACGTGACAVAVAGVLNDLSDARVTIHLRGGDLLLEWAGEGSPVFKTGPAVEVFRGEIDV
jgi:diaminopimelate epimerase